MVDWIWGVGATSLLRGTLPGRCRDAATPHGCEPGSGGGLGGVLVLGRRPACALAGSGGAAVRRRRLVTFRRAHLFCLVVSVFLASSPNGATQLDSSSLTTSLIDLRRCDLSTAWSQQDHTGETSFES